MLDKNVEPAFDNNSGKALLKFTNDYISLTQERFGTENMSSDDIKEFAKEHNWKNHKQLNMTDRETALSFVCSEDILKKWEDKNKSRSVEELTNFAEIIFEGINSVDLKSYKDFDKDPDRTFKLPI